MLTDGVGRRGSLRVRFLCLCWGQKVGHCLIASVLLLCSKETPCSILRQLLQQVKWFVVVVRTKQDIWDFLKLWSMKGCKWELLKVVNQGNLINVWSRGFGEVLSIKLKTCRYFTRSLAFIHTHTKNQWTLNGNYTQTGARWENWFLTLGCSSLTE